jgi:hypothetical protein
MSIENYEIFYLNLIFRPHGCVKNIMVHVSVIFGLVKSFRESQKKLNVHVALYQQKEFVPMKTRIYKGNSLKSQHNGMKKILEDPVIIPPNP